MQRFTSPGQDRRRALADILHEFLKETRFFAQVFGPKAKCSDEVTTARKIQDAIAAAVAQQAMNAPEREGPDEDEYNRDDERKS